MLTNCSVCKHYNSGEFQCRRHAPIVMSRNGKVCTRWPALDPEDWCGDFERGSLPSDHKSEPWPENPNA